MDIMVRKLPGGMLRGAIEDDVEAIEGLPVGKDIRMTAVVPRNNQFMRKYMALVRLGYDAFEPVAVELRGEMVLPEKNFEEFRKYLAIKAGFYDVVGYPDGGVRVRAQSISFAKMDEEAFEKLYSATIDVLLREVLDKYTREDVDRVIANLMGFV